MEAQLVTDTLHDASLQHGRHTIACAIEGLQAISHSLDARFVRCVDMIATLKGRLIVTGMGKSGHIARKIAATFASTGTPAHFVHPAEASHGDLGMISDGDIIMMLSNSGETAELEEMIAYARRFNISLIALVRREKSMLVDVADVPIILPAIPEASVTGAPTTSTTMMLAYADALAMAVLERRGFTSDDFRNFHPGGKLGQGLLRVSELMHADSELPIVQAQDKMRDVLVEITSKTFGCAIVVDDDGKLLGIITDGDLRRHMAPNLLDVSAQEVMTQHPITTTPNTLAAEVLGMMNSRAITGLVVLEEGRPVGFIHVHDCLRAGVV